MVKSIAVGLAAAVASAVSFGSFAVPIKQPKVLQAEVHPVIFQGYKSLTCFLVSWIILFWADYRFTWYGVVAAIIWVHDGVLAIIAIHMAGLGVAQSVWSGVSIAVSFAWGKLLFQEPMENVVLAIAGLVLMLLGMTGIGVVASIFGTMKGDQYGRDDIPELALPVERPADSSLQKLKGAQEMTEVLGDKNLEAERLVPHDDLQGAPSTEQETLTTSNFWEEHQFALGVVAAAWVGVCAGSMMICLKLAPPDCKGDQYAMSFGLGVGLVTLVVLGALFAWYELCSWQAPSSHFAVVSGPASLAGFLWTLGNYMSVIAVDRLGMAVGFPLVQCNLIISNIWALFYYHEIKGRNAICWFLLSTLTILAGVSLLAMYGL